MKKVQKVEIGWRHGREEGVIPVQVVYSKRRSMGLEIKRDGSVYARIPNGISGQYVMDFIKERQDWIVQKWFLIMERRKKEEERPQRDYEKNPELESLYRARARRQLEARASYFAEQMGVTYNRILVRAARTRWGSCSAQGNLNFHWKLILMPPEILDYVVVHELAHRKEMNHSARFWAEVEKVLPDYASRRKWLKDNGGQV